MRNLFSNPSGTQRQWYQVILWWEIMRIPYNLLMYIAGMLSFYIMYVTIPLLYIGMGIILNVIYTLGWVVELTIISKFNTSVGSKYPFKAYLFFVVFSIIIIIGFAVFLVFL